MEVARRLKHVAQDSAVEAAEAAEFGAKKWVWVPHPTLGYEKGYILNPSLPPGDTVEVVTESSGEHTHHPPTSLPPLNPPKFALSEDIASLTYLNEPSVVSCLSNRYRSALSLSLSASGSRAGGASSEAAGGIYTYSGLFLISLNPYSPLPIYGAQDVARYRGRRREELGPHIYAVAEAAWRGILSTSEGVGGGVGGGGMNQSVLITGESGAGKTENTKKVIQYLAAIAPSTGAGSVGRGMVPSGSSGSIAPRIGLPRSHSYKAQLNAGTERGEKEKGVGGLEGKILQANPILEGFGNARTMKNDNSSRFGKFIRILFTPQGAISGATIDWYLLEKSRVTVRSEGERGFHVFYQLLAGRGDAVDLRKKLGLTGEPGDYEFLKHSRTTIDGVDDAEEWKLLKIALDTVGFTPSEQFDIFRLLALILHIGNLPLLTSSSDQASFASSPTTTALLSTICTLLGIKVDEFSRAVLQPTVKAGREVVTQARTKRQAEDELGALCRTIYERCFGAVVERVNKALYRPNQAKSLFIGVLDIAGFEIFAVNGYEQLMINFTNERLQQFFNHHMFDLEQEEYTRENIEWTFVNFGLDLQPTIDLIESNQPIGILSTLDEECIMPKATDVTFLNKLKAEWEPARGTPAAQIHPGSAKFSTPRFGNGFVVQHYAGPVEYETTGWLQKNKDPINDNVARLLAKSDVPSIATMFKDYAELVPGRPGGASSRVKRGAFRTTAQRHREQLSALMTQLQATEPHFVRCILPNSHKRPGEVDVPLVLHQLRCNGVLEGIRIARLGYPNRLPFGEFRQRYEVLTQGVLSSGYVDSRTACLSMIQALELPPSSHKTGLTKIFFKAGVLADLEERRDVHLFDIFARLQSTARMFIARRKMKRILNRAIAIRTIQRNARIYIQLRDWPWWRLYTRVKPLLAATRQDEQLLKQKAELLLAKERADRETAEKARLEALQEKLEGDKQQVEEALAAERELNAEKDGLLQLSQQTEADLQDEIAALQADLDMLAEQLESAEADKLAAEARCDGLRLEFERSSQQTEMLSKQELIWQQKAAVLSEKLLRAEQNASHLESERIKLLESVQDGKQKVARLDEDLKRSKERLSAASAAVDAKVEDERVKRTAAEARLGAMETEIRAKEEMLVKLTSVSSGYDSLVKKKEAEIAKLNGELSKAKAENDSSSKANSQVSIQLQTTKKELEAMVLQRDARISAEQKLQAELDGLRKVVAAKTSEDSKRAEIDRSNAQELAALRQALTEISSELNGHRQSSARELDSLKLQLEQANKAHSSLTATHDAASRDVARLSKQLAEAEGALATATRSKSSLEGELATVRTRQIATDEQLADALKLKEATEKQVVATKAKLADYEDAVLAIEREKADWARKMDSTTKDLRTERSRREELESSQRAQAVEMANLKDTNEQALQQLSLVTAELQTRGSEVALLKSRENKTIVEHVHVLEKAKRMTDRELADTRYEKDRLAALVKSLEQYKSRSQGDIEDLARQNEIQRTELDKLRKSAAEKPPVTREAHQAEIQAKLTAQQTAQAATTKSQKQETRIQQLEKDLARALEIAETATISSKKRSNPPDRLLQELLLNNGQMGQEMDEQLRKGKSSSTSMNSPSRQLSSESLRSSTSGKEIGGVLKQQMSLLEARTAASDRVRYHLQAQVEEVTRDLMASDGSRESLRAATDKLRQRNQQLAELVAAEADQQRKADAASVASLQDVWKLFKSHITDERQRYSDLEGSKRTILADHRTKASEAEDLAARLQEAQLKIRRLETVTNDSPRKSVRAERQAVSGFSEASDTAWLELENGLRDQKTLSDVYLARAENAEIAKQQSERDAALLRNDMEKFRRDLEVVVKARDAKTAQCSALEKKLREVESLVEDRAFMNEDEFESRVAARMEKERSRYQKDLQDRDITIGQTRTKYQGELARLSEEQGLLRDELSKAREESRELKAREEALRLELDDEKHSSSSWKMHRDRLETRIGDLTKAFESASADCSSSQNQVVAYLAEIRDLRSKQDEVDAECAALRHTKQKLEQRITEAFDSQLNASRFSRDQAVQQLSNDKEELKASVDAMADQLKLAHQRVSKSDSYAAECLAELGKVRKANAEIDKQNSTLEKVIKDLNLRIVDLTTQSYASSPRMPAKRLEQKVEELQARLVQEASERSDAVRAQRTAERTIRESKAQLDEVTQHRDHLQQEATENGRAVLDLKEKLNKAINDHGDLLLANKRAERTIADLRQTLENLEKGGHMSSISNRNRNSVPSPRRN